MLVAWATFVIGVVWIIDVSIEILAFDDGATSRSGFLWVRELFVDFSNWFVFIDIRGSCFTATSGRLDFLLVKDLDFILAHVLSFKFLEFLIKVGVSLGHLLGHLSDDFRLHHQMPNTKVTTH